MPDRSKYPYRPIRSSSSNFLIQPTLKNNPGNMADPIPTQSQKLEKPAQNGKMPVIFQTLGNAMTDKAQYLIKQQKNMLLIKPLSQIETDKGTMLQSEDIDPSMIDLRYVALAILDHVMESSAFHPGCEPDEIVSVAQQEVFRMAPAISEKLAKSVAKRVYDRLRNAKGGFQRFSEDYYDPPNKRFASHQFDYLRVFTDPDDGSRIWVKLGDAAQLVFLGMLEMADEFLEEAELIMLRKAIERGRFDDALQSAVRARKRSINHRVFIREKLLRARRSIASVDWQETVLPELEQAREHLKSRIKDEDEITKQISDKLGKMSDEPLARTALIRLKETIEDTQKRHSLLYQELISANERYRKILSRGFRSRGSSNVRDPEQEILNPLLLATCGELINFSSHIWASLFPPIPVRLFDWSGLFAAAMKGSSEGDDILPDDSSADAIPIEEVPPRYPRELVEKVEQHLLDRLDTHEEISLSRLIGQAIQDRWPYDHIRLLVLISLMAWTGLDGHKNIQTQIRGDYEVGRFSGDNILFKRNTT